MNPTFVTERLIRRIPEKRASLEGSSNPSSLTPSSSVLVRLRSFEITIEFRHELGQRPLRSSKIASDNRSRNTHDRELRGSLSRSQIQCQKPPQHFSPKSVRAKTKVEGECFLRSPALAKPLDDPPKTGQGHHARLDGLPAATGHTSLRGKTALVSSSAVVGAHEKQNRIVASNILPVELVAKVHGAHMVMIEFKYANRAP